MESTMEIRDNNDGDDDDDDDDDEDEKDLDHSSSSVRRRRRPRKMRVLLFDVLFPLPDLVSDAFLVAELRRRMMDDETSAVRTDDLWFASLVFFVLSLVVHVSRVCVRCGDGDPEDVGWSYAATIFVEDVPQCVVVLTYVDRQLAAVAAAAEDDNVALTFAQTFSLSASAATVSVCALVSANACARNERSGCSVVARTLARGCLLCELGALPPASAIVFWCDHVRSAAPDWLYPACWVVLGANVATAATLLGTRVGA